MWPLSGDLRMTAHELATTLIATPATLVQMQRSMNSNEQACTATGEPKELDFERRRPQPPLSYQLDDKDSYSQTAPHCARARPSAVNSISTQRISTMTRSISVADTLRIHSHDPDRPSRVVGLRPTGNVGRWAKATEVLVNHANIYTRDSADVRASGLAPRLRAERLQEVFIGFAGRLESSAKEIRDGAENLRQRMTSAGRLSYDNVPAASVHLDLARLARLDALAPTVRARTVAELAEVPASNLSLAEALVRLPRDLTGISSELHTALRISLWAKTTGADEFTGMDNEMSELALAHAAVRESVGACVDLGVGAGALVQVAPAAAALASTRFALSWPSARAALAEAA